MHTHTHTKANVVNPNSYILYGSGTSHVMTASPNSSSRAPWRVDDAVVGKGNLDGHLRRLDIPAHARTAHKGLLQLKKTGGRSLLNCPSCPHSVKELN